MDHEDILIKERDVILDPLERIETDFGLFWETSQQAPLPFKDE